MSQVSDVATAAAEVPTPPIRGTSLLRRSFRLWRTRIGAALVGAIVLLALVGPYVAPYGPSAPVGAPNSNPGGKALLGTDYLGQDVLSRVLSRGVTRMVATSASRLSTTYTAAISMASAWTTGRSWLTTESCIAPPMPE